MCGRHYSLADDIDTVRPQVSGRTAVALAEGFVATRASSPQGFARHRLCSTRTSASMIRRCA